MKVCLWTECIQWKHLRLLKGVNVMSVNQNMSWAWGILYGSDSFLVAIFLWSQWDSDIGIMRLIFWLTFIRNSISSTWQSNERVFYSYCFSQTAFMLNRGCRYFYYIPSCFLSIFLSFFFFFPHTVSFSVLSVFLLCPNPQPILVLISLPRIKMLQWHLAMVLFIHSAHFLMSIYYSLSNVLSARNATVYKMCKKPLHFWL